MTDRELTRPDGLVFDLDGTLVDTVRARIDGWLEALREASLPVIREQLGPLIGMDGKRLARTVAEAGGRRLTDEETDVIDRAAGEAFDRINRPRPLPGARDLPATLDGLGIRWVIATSSRAEQVQRSVAALALGAEPMIVDGSQVEHAKPAPDILLLAARRLGLPPPRCWAVGDSTWDVRAARAADMPAVCVTAGSAVGAAALREAGATLVVGTLTDLETLVRELSQGPAFS